MTPYGVLPSSVRALRAYGRRSTWWRVRRRKIARAVRHRERVRTRRLGCHEIREELLDVLEELTKTSCSTSSACAKQG